MFCKCYFFLFNFGPALSILLSFALLCVVSCLSLILLVCLFLQCFRLVCWQHGFFSWLVDWFENFILLRSVLIKTCTRVRYTKVSRAMQFISITLTGSKVTASIASLRISVQLFGGSRCFIKLDSWDNPQERHIDNVANSPVRVTSVVVGALVWAETRLGVAFMLACLNRWHTVKINK